MNKDRIEDKNLELDYYIFDWDDNVLHMPTKIHLEKEGKSIAVGTRAYATVRKDKSYQLQKDAFREFMDGTGDFLRDVQQAIKAEAYAPSFSAFKKALIEARLFCIVTARGHASLSIRGAVEYFIREVLTLKEQQQMMENIKRFNHLAHEDTAQEDLLRTYLDLNGYIGVSSPGFIQEYNQMFIGDNGAANPEEMKTYAVEDFVKKVYTLAQKISSGNKTISFGFSDDDLGNLAAMRAYIRRELKVQYPDVRFVLFDTSNLPVEREYL